MSGIKGVMRSGSAYPMAAGVMTIVAACICVFSGGLNLFSSLWGYLYINGQYYPVNDPQQFVAGIFGVLAFILGLASGTTSLRRKHLALSITGMCFIIVSVPVMVLEMLASVRAHYGTVSPVGMAVFFAPPMVLAMLSLIFVAVSHREFS